MAKTSTKKSRNNKSNKKKSKAAIETNDNPEVIYDDDDEDLNKDDETISSEEDEDDGDDERRRHKLLEAIMALGGTKRKKKLGERSEPAVQMSEFTVSAEAESDRIQLKDLIGSVDQIAAVPAKTRKQLNNLQQNKKTLQTPLSRQESGRIQRDVAFQKVATEVTRWKSVIQQNQKAEQLIFPLDQESAAPRPLERVVMDWKAQTPLEQEVFALLSANKQPIHDPVLTPAEEASVRAMSLEEAKVRRAELQKARALQSYYEAKARREKKIKSKKYHRVQNKAKRKEFLKKFDEMVKTDPAAALEELNKMELARMQERMSLKHQNSSKWARSKAIMAKYDQGARKAMQQQLEVHKDLTQKLVTSLNEEEDEEEDRGDPQVLPDFVNEAESGAMSSNPWMRAQLPEGPAENEQTAEGAAAAPALEEDEEEEEEEEKETEEEALLREFDNRRKLRQAQDSEEAPVTTEVDEEETEAVAAQENEAQEEDPSIREEQELSQFNSLLRGLTEARQDADEHVDTSVPLNEGLMRIQTLEDMDLLTQEESEPQEAPEPAAGEKLQTEEKPVGKKNGRKRKRGIELKDVLTKDTKVIKVPLVPTVTDAEEETLDQRDLIKEAFAGDDVVSDFLKDKKAREDAGRPKVVDLTLPGWGEWGGTGLKPSRKKRRKFRVQTNAPPPRKDQHLPSVIMSEQKSSSLRLHQVSSLPFPFQNHEQFQSSIRSPLGRSWNTEQTVRKVTKPRVVTRLGAIIEPLAEDVLMQNKNQSRTGTDLRRLTGKEGDRILLTDQ